MPGKGGGGRGPGLGKPSFRVMGFNNGNGLRPLTFSLFPPPSSPGAPPCYNNHTAGGERGGGCAPKNQTQKATARTSASRRSSGRPADKLRNNMDAAEYKHVVLGLIFLKYISDAFEERQAGARRAPGAIGSWKTRGRTTLEDPDEYRAENVFWVPKEARWSHLQANAKQPDHRQAARRRDGRHRARQPDAQGRACPRTTPGPASTSSGWAN